VHACELHSIRSCHKPILAEPTFCSGYRFALVEIKAILFVLVRNFVFEPCEPAIDIEKKTS
jgi:hypothetical protein